MKVAITAEGSDIESQVDQRFGRCNFFLIFDTDNPESFQAVQNEGTIQGHGAGIRAAQQVGDIGAEAVITGMLGPNASKVLDRLAIPAYRARGVVKDAIESFKNDGLEKIGEVSEKHAGLKDIPSRQGSEERIFFPLLDNVGEDSEISDHFGHAPFFGIYNVEEKRLEIIENNLDHADPTKSPIDQIVESVNPTTIFAKGIGGRAIGIIAQMGLSLKTGPFNTVKEAIANLDKLEDLTRSCGH